MMVRSDAADFFMLRLGTPHPTWTLTDDSNIIGLGDSVRVISAVIELDRDQVAQIRGLGQSVERIRCICDLSGRELRFYLHGKQLSQGIWAGIASSDPEYLPSEAVIARLEIPNFRADEGARSQSSALPKLRSQFQVTL
ncbi:hypothetical protein DM992_39140 [Burkholderia sp. JP2-270]|nr:hypothetical protein [Burkholderia sp. JP2-270]AWV05243.1 hypothetical protein DM992_39140 [Burkholderia sp. JP2-270]